MKNSETLKNIGYYIIGVVAYFITKLLIATCKKEIIRSEDAKIFHASKKPAIYALWHGRIFPMIFLRPTGINLHAVISRHGDGEVIATVLKLGGVDAVRGSTDRKKGETKVSTRQIKVTSAKNRGGSFVIRECVRILRDAGDSIAITPDGPKGPRYIYKTNSIKIASETKTPIIPTSFSASRVYTFNSWDKFTIPMPFSTIKVHYGDCIYIPELNSDEEVEKYGKLVENALNKLTTELDEQFNVKLN